MESVAQSYCMSDIHKNKQEHLQLTRDCTFCIHICLHLMQYGRHVSWQQPIVPPEKIKALNANIVIISLFIVSIYCSHFNWC